MSQDIYAVQVSSACKGYPSGKEGQQTIVLDNLNSNVRKGTIYSLLGASGCGKTTLLSCMAGIRALDSGDVWVFGARPGSRGSGVPGPTLGYMPQETALYDFLSIQEILSYYGRIYGMGKADISSRIDFLVGFLQLPGKGSLIRNLSGGQLRRVSLSVALIHQPPLLILDEPTVGIDPLIRQEIWEHLQTLVRIEKTTVIITTHYIEESRKSDVVGLLRKGKLLCEESPDFLLAQHCTKSLEKVVLSLCEVQQVGNDKGTDQCQSRRSSTASVYSWSEGDEVEEQVKITKIRRLSNISQIPEIIGEKRVNIRRTSTRPSSIPDLQESFWGIVWAMILRYFIALMRFPPLTAFQLFLPIMQIVLFQGVIGKPPIGLKIALVSDDLPFNTSFALDSHCSESQANCSGSELDWVCSFIQNLDGSVIQWVPTNSSEIALTKIQEGNAMALLQFPTNFSAHLKERLLYRHFAVEEILLGSTLKMRVDMTESISAAILQRRMLNAALSFLEDSVRNCGGNEELVKLPIKFNRIYGDSDNFDEGWSEFTQPGLIIVLMFMLTAAPAFLWVHEMRRGMVERDAMAGVRLPHLLVSSIISDSLMLCVQISVFFGSSALFFGVNNRGSWLDAFLLVYVSSLSGLFIARAVGMAVSHEFEIMVFLIGCNGWLWITGGIIWPFEGIPSFYRPFCLALPTSYPLNALRAVLSKGWGLSHPKVIFGFVPPLIYITISVIAMFQLSKRKG